MGKPIIKQERVETICDKRFLRLYDLNYVEGRHYFDATRRPVEKLVAVKSDAEFQTMLPDAVTIAVVLHLPEEEPKLLMNYEYRYPIGQFLLSPVAGLLDPADEESEDPIRTGAAREIFEETGIRVSEGDTITVLNPCAFSSPGMTDESNAFLCADITLPDLSSLTHGEAESTELFNGFELLTREQAAEIYRTGRDKYGNTFSLATWALLGYFAFGNR
ncbi:MAG: NUDIX hydrolase [Lachnospiraceae bacterium]|nr:NUDIX hydrolase [Lachnospiraceae bacterium]